jgi:hypothetical protein
MAARFKTKLHTLDGTWETIASIINSDNDTFLSSIDFRAHKANSGDVVWADVDASEGGYLEAREAADWDLTNKFVKSSDIYVKGIVGDRVHITVLG